VAAKAVEQGLAGVPTTYQAEFERASAIIQRSREMTRTMMATGLITSAD
jgi:hypothetical protein